MRRTSTCVIASLWLAAASAAAPRVSAADSVVLPLPAEDQREITAQLGSGIVGKALPSAPITDPSYPALLMRLKFEGKVGPANTEDTAYYLFAPNVGVVAMISQEDVEAFWIIHIDTTIGKVLASN